jgi:hypothetical protein
MLDHAWRFERFALEGRGMLDHAWRFERFALEGRGMLEHGRGFERAALGASADVLGELAEELMDRLEPPPLDDAYLIPTTIESGPVRCSTRVWLNPASRIQPMQSAPV